MPTPFATLFEKVCHHARQTIMLQNVSALLNWDERTYLPDGGGEYRAEQSALLAGMIHMRCIDPSYGAMLEELSEAPDSKSGAVETVATVRELLRDYNKATRLPTAIVEAIERATVRGQQIWVEARKRDDFAAFVPALEEILRLKREYADAAGYEENRYDALLDDYEPGATTKEVSRVLGSLRSPLAELVAKIQAAGRKPSNEVFRRRTTREQQRAFGIEVAEKIGFSFQDGRLDDTHHPFCETLGPNDCRITTRYDETFLQTSLYGTMHEAGHGIYEQGLRKDWFGLAPGVYASLGVHESQSRMWENQVGRSQAFWEFFLPKAKKAFSPIWDDVSSSDAFGAANVVQPSLIRVEADEATYNLHILVRFELEQALVSGDLPLTDLPGAWRQKYRELVGIEPTDDRNGCLQDVHWSAGLFGYFPTYTLGNLFAAQLFEAAERELGDLQDSFRRGEFHLLRDWLRRRVHEAGRTRKASDLIAAVTGQKVDSEPLLRHLKNKLLPLYGIS